MYGPPPLPIVVTHANQGQVTGGGGGGTRCSASPLIRAAKDIDL